MRRDSLLRKALLCTILWLCSVPLVVAQAPPPGQPTAPPLLVVAAGKVKGTGLGAYSALLMAKIHGGGIDMRTSELNGTTLTVRLPL